MTCCHLLDSILICLSFSVSVCKWDSTSTHLFRSLSGLKGDKLHKVHAQGLSHSRIQYMVLIVISDCLGGQLCLPLYH